MNFSESREQRDFAASLSGLLDSSDVPSVVRAWSRGDYASGRKLWARIADSGVTALAMPEQHGGFGAHPVDLTIAFEVLGRFAVPGPWVESVAVLPALLAGTPAADQLSAIAAGETLATVSMPPHVPFALDATAADAIFVVDGGRLSSASASMEHRSVDRARRLATVSARDSIASVDAQRAFELGSLATAAQILGAGQAVLEMSRTYATQRVQFGRVIGGFQAVKHLLADALVGLDLARPLLLGAAVALADDAPTFGRDVSAAKVACTEAAYRSARTALQVHGAIGYTSEHDLALWLTKIRALTSAWGTQASHRARVLAAIS